MSLGEVIAGKLIDHAIENPQRIVQVSNALFGSPDNVQGSDPWETIKPYLISGAVGFAIGFALATWTGCPKESEKKS